MLYCPAMEKAIPHSQASEGSGKTRKAHRLLVVLGAGLVLLTVAGLVLLGAYFYLTRQPAASDGWVKPLEAVQASAVAPDMAVLPLAGYADDQAIRSALDAGEVETAYAILAYSTLLPDTVRSGHWLLLASRLEKTDPRRAAIAFQAAMDQVSLSPDLSDNARADLSLQATRGMTALGKSTPARLALAQAENIARYSLTLLPAQRRHLLEQVAQGYRTIGDTQTADAITSKLDSASVGPGIKVEPSAALLPTLHGSVVLSGDVTAALAARQQAAAALATRWLNSAPSGRTTLAEDLGQALVAEDAARQAFYGGADSLSVADRLAMLHDKVAWLTIKYQVANGACGTSLVPDWEKRVDDLRTELAGAYTDLINGYGQQLDTLSVGDATFGRVELLRQGVLWTRLGLFPDHAEEALSEQLINAARQLWTRQGGAGLVIVVQQVDDQHYYLLSGADAPQKGS